MIRQFLRQRGIYLLFGIAGIFLVTLIILSFRTNAELKRSNEIIQQTNFIIQNSNLLIINIKDAETNNRAYVLSGEETFFIQYRTAVANIDKTIILLQNYTTDSSYISSQIHDVHQSITTKINEYNRIIELRNSKNIEDVVSLLKSARSKLINENIITIINLIIRNQAEVADNANLNIQKYSNRTVALLVTTVLFIFGMISLFVVLNFKLSNNRMRTFVNLHQIVKQYVMDDGSIDTYVTEKEIIANFQSSIQNAISFVNDILNSNYHENYRGITAHNKPLNQNKLAGLLVEVSNRIKVVEENDKNIVKIEEQRERATQALTRFNEILRHNSNNVEVLSQDIIKNLIEYLGANQGGLFVLNDSNKDELFFEMVAAYAFDRRRHVQKKIRFDEGLIGMCAFEKEIIYLTELPKDYIKITSGLGEANPRSLILVPLKVENTVLGIIEIASFNEFSNDDITFIEKLAGSIGATLSIAKINAQTAKLLSESQLQAQELAAQDEEMRQNMEMLQYAQAAAIQRETEMKGIIAAIDNTLIRAEIHTDGTMLVANSFLLSTMEYEWEEIENQHIRMFIPQSEYKKFTQIWENLLTGIPYQGVTKRISKTGKEIWLLMSYTPVVDDDGNILKILYLANNITEQKQIEEDIHSKTRELEAQEEEMRLNMEELVNMQEDAMKQDVQMKSILSAIDSALLKSEFDVEGKILQLNDLFTQTFSISKSDAQDISINQIINIHNTIDFNKIWGRVCSGEQHNGIWEAVSAKNETIWLLGTFSPVKNFETTVQKILFLSHDITALKNNEIKSHIELNLLKEHEEEISRQFESMKNLQSDCALKLQEQKKVESELKRYYEEKVNNLFTVWSTHLDKVESQQQEFLRNKDELIQKLNEVKSATDSQKTNDKPYQSKEDIDKIYDLWLENLDKIKNE